MSSQAFLDGYLSKEAGIGDWIRTKLRNLGAARNEPAQDYGSAADWLTEDPGAFSDKAVVPTAGTLKERVTVQTALRNPQNVHPSVLKRAREIAGGWEWARIRDAATAQKVSPNFWFEAQKDPAVTERVRRMLAGGVDPQTELAMLGAKNPSSTWANLHALWGYMNPSERETLRGIVTQKQLPSFQSAPVFLPAPAPKKADEPMDAFRPWKK